MNTDTMPRSRAAAKQRVYASFNLGAEEYALDVCHVSEVVNLPSAITPMPLAPDFVAGVFNLRGAIIPILDARRLLAASGPVQATNGKVVVVEHAGMRLGLLVDETGRVLRPRPEEQTLFDYEDNSAHRVVAGVLKIGDSLVRILDLDRLVALEDVPHARADDARRARAKLQRRRCIIFRIGHTRLAFAIGGIDEIVRASGIEPSPIQEDLCEGIMHIRSRVVPVVRFAAVLRTGTTVDPERPEARVVVLALGESRVGLLVDAVESIEAYADDELMQVPVLTRHKAGMFVGCLDLDERGHVFLLDSARVLDNDELVRVTGNFSRLFSSHDDTARHGRRTEQRRPYLWFTARDAFALPMPAVREIIECRTGFIAMPGAPDFVAGMINVRGHLVTVVDLRAFYGLDKGNTNAAQDALRRIVVLDEGETLLGLLVDSVESIARVEAADRIPVPLLMRNAIPEVQRKDVCEIIQVAADEEQSVHIRVLDPARLFASIAAQDSQESDG